MDSNTQLKLDLSNKLKQPASIPVTRAASPKQSPRLEVTSVDDNPDAGMVAKVKDNDDSFRTDPDAS